jgi:cytochrome c-type biogenesis protein CcmE
MTKGAQIAIGAGVIAALLGWYGYANLGQEGTYQYYKTVAEFRAAADEVQGKELRVHGYVATQSIDRRLETKRVRFAVQNDPPHAGIASGQLLIVEYQGLDTPDLFKDGAEVVVEGRLEREDGELLFVADNVLAKCPSKFQAEVGSERATGTAL